MLNYKILALIIVVMFSFFSSTISTSYAQLPTESNKDTSSNNTTSLSPDIVNRFLTITS